MKFNQIELTFLSLIIIDENVVLHIYNYNSKIIIGDVDN